MNNTENKKEVGFSYGPLSKRLEVQAQEQGYTLGKKAEHFERCIDAIFILMFGDILTDSQMDKAYRKLNKKIIKELRPFKEVENE